MKCLVSMHDKLDHGVVFIETHIESDKAPHCVRFYCYNLYH